ncbi:MAG TPA: diphosphomevalonate decarboxylase [Bacteroidales bacterium]|nr:diphosphomevalonate decarboxylase [Bacteroidales bacterium]
MNPMSNTKNVMFKPHAVQTPDGFETAWQSPSNIALVKYWGKIGNQIPMNPSISMTLDTSVTRTAVRARKKDKPGSNVQLRYIFDGKENPDFQARVLALLRSLDDELAFLKDYALEIDSSNTFPHSAGIASSASSMSALALCLLSIENVAGKKKSNIHSFLKKASHIARLGSGSASRSVYGGFVLWGKSSVIPKSGDHFAIPLPVKIHPVFDGMRDSILVIDQGEKPVSSRSGHEKMDQHPFKKGRIMQAGQNLQLIAGALNTGNWEMFSRVVENEALTLHGLMMSSHPGFLLIQPNTLKAIEKISTFRNQTKTKITYTLDAGPNLHVLYPQEDSSLVQQFIHGELAAYCHNNYVIHDQIGRGPHPIS